MAVRPLSHCWINAYLLSTPVLNAWIPLIIVPVVDLLIKVRYMACYYFSVDAEVTDLALARRGSTRARMILCLVRVTKFDRSSNSEYATGVASRVNINDIDCP